MLGFHERMNYFAAYIACVWSLDRASTPQDTTSDIQGEKPWPTHPVTAYADIHHANQSNTLHEYGTSYQELISPPAQ
ncbi:hypothetical protein N7522_002444 [Penicillium canescens]|nr:hypothetical protein N7522_002444 [Penicillium canescens]